MIGWVIVRTLLVSERSLYSLGSVILTFANAIFRILQKMSTTVADGEDNFRDYRIDEWLIARHQRVVLNGYESAWLYVIRGVPHGLFLGPCCSCCLLMVLTVVL